VIRPGVEHVKRQGRLISLKVCAAPLPAEQIGRFHVRGLSSPVYGDSAVNTADPNKHIVDGVHGLQRSIFMIVYGI
jgi:hypothetical protein